MSIASVLSIANKLYEVAGKEEVAKNFKASVGFYKEAKNLYSQCVQSMEGSPQAQVQAAIYSIERKLSFLDINNQTGTSQASFITFAGAAGPSGTIASSSCHTEPQQSKHAEAVLKFIKLKNGEGYQEDFKNIIGLGSVKRALFNVIMPKTKFSKLFSDLGINDRGKTTSHCLLYGFPGTAKTSLVRAFATYAKFDYLPLTPSDILGSYVGESESNMKAAFEAASASPTVLFFDEIDGLLASSKATSSGLVNEFLTRANTANKNLIIFGVTNYPYNIPTNVLRRFENQIYVPLPIKQERVQLLKFYMGNHSSIFDDTDYLEIAGKTRGFSGYDLMRLTKFVKMQPIVDVQTAKFFIALREDEESPTYWYALTEEHPLSERRSYTSIDPARLKPRPMLFGDFLNGLNQAKRTTDVDDEDPTGTVQKMMKFVNNGK